MFICDTSCFCIQNLTSPACLSSEAGCFVSCLVGNSEDPFSREGAHIEDAGVNIMLAFIKDEKKLNR